MNVKFFSRIVVVALLWITTVSCGNANDDIEPLLDVSKTFISLPEDGGTADVTVTSNNRWSVNGLTSWLQLSQTSGNSGDIIIKLTAGLNDTGSTRSTILNISLNNGNIRRTVKVSQVSKIEPVTQDPNFYIFLCFGQSNMEGQGVIQTQDMMDDSRFKVLQAVQCSNRNMESWYAAIPPLCQCNTGLSPVDYFGKTMVAKLPKNITVGVINVAVGGSDIRLFDKDLYKNYVSTYPDEWYQSKIRAYDGNPRKRLIDLAKQAQKVGVIKGILLHQGEANTGDKNWPSYVKKIYNEMLADLSLNANSVPLLSGEVLSASGNCCGEWMNPIINSLPNTVPTAHVISSDGCTGQDPAHFDSQGYRTLGKRYGDKMLELLGY